MVSINLLVVFVSVILSVVLGFVWYGPLFGKKWMELNGMKMPDQKPAFSVMIRPIIISFVGALFMSFILARLIAVGGAYFGVSGIGNGLATALMVWIGFIVPVHFNSAGWEGKPWTLFFINTGYWLVYLMIISVIIALWV